MSQLRRTILLTLSLLVLMSSIGLSVGVHVCGGALQDMALFHKAEACPMEQKQQPLPCHGGDADEHAPANPEDNSCCQDNLIAMDDMEEAVASKVSSLKNPDLHLIAVLYTSFQFLLLQEADAPKASPLSYASPPLIRDIPVLIQSFLL